MVTSEEISDASFAALAAMHLRINAGESRWAIQLEVSYIPLFALRRYDPERAVHPHLERGKGAPLHRMRHDASWVVQRQVLRERGMVLAGPAPASLIDPVAPDDLRAAMRQALRSWAAPMLEQDRPFDWHGYQTYTVLTLCRILYTLENGSVVSKITAARWALTALDARWTGLIERAAEGRLAPQREIPEGDVDGTLAFVRYALEQ